MYKNMVDRLFQSLVLAPVAFSASVKSLGADATDLGNLAFLVSVGAFAFDGTNKVSIVLQHSDTDIDANYVDCGIDDVYAADCEVPASGVVKILDAGADASKNYLCEYRGNKKFARISLVEAGTVTTTISISALSTNKNTRGTIAP